MKVYLYVVGATENKPKNYDIFPQSDVKVPYKVNSETIFFGACMKLIREDLFKEYLIFERTPNGEFEVKDEIYLVGMNAFNHERIRKIIWVGKIRMLFTFERAFKRFNQKDEYKGMISDPKSPLHFKPVYKDNLFKGYEHRSEFHLKRGGWKEDLIVGENNSNVTIIDKSSPPFRQILLKNEKNTLLRQEVFVRDCCFLCENLFFAEGKGLRIDEEILGIIRTALKKEPFLSAYYIFGKDSADRAKTLRRKGLELYNQQAEQFITVLTQRIPNV